MSRLRHFAHASAHRFGMEIRRYPQSDPLWRIASLLRLNRVDLVLDVGANDGGYATSIRRHGYSGRIISFEPTSAAFTRLRQRSDDDPLWECRPWAIGDRDGDVVINVAGNSEASSSVLPMLDRHLEAAPQSAYVSAETVCQYRLESLAESMTRGRGDRVFIKMDVQGYEDAVLRGAVSLLDEGFVCGLQMELSFTPLYEGAMTWRDGFAWAERYGMSLMSLDAGFTDRRTGRMLQADGVFFREG